MADACVLQPGEEDHGKLDDGERGQNNILVPEVERYLESVKVAIESQIERIDSIIGAEQVERIWVASKEAPVSERDISEEREKISRLDGRTVIILPYAEQIPAFVSQFRDTGQKISESIKEYPESLPEVKVYTPIIPTVDNLRRMIKGNNPISPWGKEIELHHDKQSPAGPLMMVERDYHRRKGAHGLLHRLGKGEGLSPQEYAAYRNQKKAIWKTIAKSYLGKEWAKVFENLVEGAEERGKVDLG